MFIEQIILWSQDRPIQAYCLKKKYELSWNVMKTQVLKIDPFNIDKDKTKRIASVLKKNGVIVYPTDTFYGLGGNCFSEDVIRKVYLLKKRDPSKPLSVVVSNIDMLDHIAVDLTDLFEAVSAQFWPGPLTLVLRAAPHLPHELLGGKGDIAVRWPDHVWLQEMIEEAGFPLIATSANLAGEKEIRDPEDAKQVFQGEVDIIIDGGRTPGGLPSTILDLSRENPKILREGAVPISDLKDYLG